MKPVGLLLAEHLDDRDDVEEDHNAEDVGLDAREHGALIGDGTADGGIDFGMGGRGEDAGEDDGGQEQLAFHVCVCVFVCGAKGCAL